MAEEPSPACCRQVRRRGARQRPPVDGSWFVDLLWSLPSTAAHLRRPEPVSRLAEGHPKGLALTRARTAPSSGCRGQGSRCAPAIEGFALSRKAFSSSIGLRMLQSECLRASFRSRTNSARSSSLSTVRLPSRLRGSLAHPVPQRAEGLPVALCLRGWLAAGSAVCATPSCIGICLVWLPLGRWTGSSCRCRAGVWTCGSSTPSGPGSPARAASVNWRCMTTPSSGRGGIRSPTALLTALLGRRRSRACPATGTNDAGQRDASVTGQRQTPQRRLKSLPDRSIKTVMFSAPTCGWRSSRCCHFRRPLMGRAV